MTTITVSRALAEAEDIKQRNIIGIYPLSVVALADEVQRLRAALAQQAEPSGWMPISTAPKDGGRIILGYAGTGFSEEGFWSDDAKANHWRMVGWFASSDNLLTDKPSQPTHWQPLPNPPERSNG